MWFRCVKYFWKNEQCPVSLQLNYERAKVNHDLHQHGISEAVAEEVEISAPYDGVDDPDTIDRHKKMDKISDEAVMGGNVNSGKISK